MNDRKTKYTMYSVTKVDDRSSLGNNLNSLIGLIGSFKGKRYLPDPFNGKSSQLCIHKSRLALTLKKPRKPISENVVCLCRLLNILANFSNLFLHIQSQCGPCSDCLSSLIWVHTVCKNDF